MKKVMNLGRMVLMLFLLCVFLTISASAVVVKEQAGIYGTIIGINTQSRNDPNIFNTSVSVTQNPDGAKLETIVQYTNNGTPLTKLSKISNSGATQLLYDFPIYFTIEGIPNLATIAQCVKSTHSTGFYCLYSQAPINIP